MDDIKIMAHVEPSRPDVCRFSVDRMVHEGSARFADAAAAKGSPLVEALFAVPEVVSVKISGKDVVVGKKGEEPWRPVAGKVAEAIRAHLRSGQPAISTDFVDKRMPDAEIRTRIQELLDVQINPAVASHGGVIDLLDVKDGRVFLRMGGGCQGCASSTATLKLGVERAIRQALPDVDEILDVTDHASGSNPYYAPAHQGH
jgi:Fe-S cluster biogenesis protein NfuA